MVSEDEFYSGEESEGADNYYCDYDDDDDENENYSDQGDVVPDDDNDDICKNYIVLSEEDIRRCQEEDITKICSALSLSRNSASILLRNYNWSVEKAHEAWFADEEKVRKSVGLIEKPIVSYPDNRKLKCRICFDMFKRCKMCAAGCGHPFCESCWKSYIRISISDGAGCLSLRCPDLKCVAAVDEDMVIKFVCEEDRKKYSRFVIRSYVEGSKKAKWCPAPECENAVELEKEGGGYDVSCKCEHPFCWNCSEDAHRPVDCDTVAKWVLKNRSEAENTDWLIANTKPCPKCRKPIEKNHGCMHMTCAFPCRFEFCWMCLGSWEEHGEKTGGFFACNIYKEAKQEGKFNKEEQKREMAEMALERYTHYYERWAGNEKSRVKAIADLRMMLELDIERLSNIQALTVSQLKFITDAWHQIIECRRVLKWTYAYGYYLPENEQAKKQLFEYLQGQAESCLERLHDCAEKELKVFLDAKGPSDNFNEFSTKLIGLTNVTHNYFENLVRGLENGLVDIACKT